MEMTKENLHKILSYGNYILSESGKRTYEASSVAQDFKEFMDNVNLKIIEKYSIDKVFMHIDTFLTEVEIGKPLRVVGIIVNDYSRVINNDKSEWMIIQEANGPVQVFRNYIENIPELEYVLQFLDGDEPHPIWYTYGDNSYHSVRLDYAMHLEALVNSGMCKTVKKTTIDITFKGAK